MATIVLPNMISSADFIQKIEEIKKKSGTDYIDAVIDYCTKNNIEIETAASIIKSNSSIKSKIQIEAEELNSLEKTGRLPI